MTLLQAVCCFPKLLSALLANDAAHVAILRAGVRPLLAASQPQPKFWEGRGGAQVGPPMAARPPPQPAVPFGAAYTTEVAFPSDWRSAEELDSHMLESMYTILGTDHPRMRAATLLGYSAGSMYSIHCMSQRCQQVPLQGPVYPLSMQELKVARNADRPSMQELKVA